MTFDEVKKWLKENEYKVLIESPDNEVYSYGCPACMLAMFSWYMATHYQAQGYPKVRQMGESIKKFVLNTFADHIQEHDGLKDDTTFTI